MVAIQLLALKEDLLRVKDALDLHLRAGLTDVAALRPQAEALDRIGETLAECGSSFDQVVKATVWLSDMRHFAGFNEVYKAFFGAALPVRSTVASALALGVDVEIEVQAFVGDA